LIHGPPQVVRLIANFHEDLIQMSLPIRLGMQSVDLIFANLGGEHRAKPVPPEPHGFMADPYAVLMQMICHIPRREREPVVHHHCQRMIAGLVLK